MCNALQLVVDGDAALMEAILLVALEANLEACMAGLDCSDEMDNNGTSARWAEYLLSIKLSTHNNEGNPL